MVALNRLNQHVVGRFFCSPSDKNHRSNIASQMENTHAELQTDTCKEKHNPFWKRNLSVPSPPGVTSFHLVRYYCSAVSLSLLASSTFSLYFLRHFLRFLPVATRLSSSVWSGVISPVMKQFLQLFWSKRSDFFQGRA